jgi:quinol monooxygenase YgiN
MIIVHAVLHAQPAHRDRYIAGLRDMRTATLEHDSGCLRYDFWQDINDPDRFICVEEWTDMASLKAHLDADHHIHIAAELEPWRARPAEIHVFTAEPTAL